MSAWVGEYRGIEGEVIHDVTFVNHSPYGNYAVYEGKRYSYEDIRNEYSAFQKFGVWCLAVLSLGIAPFFSEHIQGLMFEKGVWTYKLTVDITDKVDKVIATTERIREKIKLGNPVSVFNASRLPLNFMGKSIEDLTKTADLLEQLLDAMNLAAEAIGIESPVMMESNAADSDLKEVLEALKEDGCIRDFTIVPGGFRFEPDWPSQLNLHDIQKLNLPLKSQITVKRLDAEIGVFERLEDKIDRIERMCERFARDEDCASLFTSAIREVYQQSTELQSMEEMVKALILSMNHANPLWVDPRSGDGKGWFQIEATNDKNSFLSRYLKEDLERVFDAFKASGWIQDYEIQDPGIALCKIRFKPGSESYRRSEVGIVGVTIIGIKQNI